MRRALPVLLLGALLAAAFATASTAGGRATACPTKPGPYSTKDKHIFQLDADGVTLDTLSDARGNSVKFVGSVYAVGREPPGWNDNSFFNSTAGGTEIESEIIFDSGNPNTYAAHGHLGAMYPTAFRVLRYGPGIDVDGSATWMLMREPASNFTLVYGNGRSLSSLRLCLDWHRNGTIDDDIAPLGWVEGPAAGEFDPPRISERVLRVDATTATIAITATDTGSPRASGVAGIGWTYRNGTGGGFYRGPIRVPRTATLFVWAADRAGNDTSADVDVASLVH
ncbi:MAG TPA: hypothetical protein VMB53_15620 [Gaiellaceae bacterium]|nr:hypothetical protein [Gaiellaceae bacterium]